MATNPSQGMMPTIRIENIGANQTNVPFTFGQVFKLGAIKPGAGLEARLANGEVVPLQVDYKATHADGSVRHAIISGILPTLFAKEERTLSLLETRAKSIVSKALSNSVTPEVEITIDGLKYSTKGSKFGEVIEWISGPVVSEGIISAELLDSNGKPHTHLNVRAGVRVYSSGNVRVEVIVENTKTWISATKLTYEVVIKLGGKTVFEQKALMQYRHSRWRQVVWTGAVPAIHIKQDTAYIIDSKAVSNYNRALVIPVDKGVDDTYKAIKPMQIGPAISYMPMTGGRSDIGSLPNWCVAALLSMDKRHHKTMIDGAEGSGTWSIHYRDEKTGYPVRTDNEENKNLTTHGNLWSWGPLPVPRYVNNNGSLGENPNTEDTAHQPSFVYLPYLLTGEYYYLEELHFWASWNPLGTDPKNHGNGAGLVRWQQVRGQAWSLRTLGHAAYITPDDHPMKAYFTKQLDNNLNFYHQTYVVGNPNKLGIYDGSGPNEFEVENSPVWQDDFMTWSFGYLAELGFSKAESILKWKSTYPVGRMTSEGFCWIMAPSYALKFREAKGKPAYDTFSQLYKENWGGAEILSDGGGVFRHPDGIKFIDLPCGSKAQADFLSLANNGTNWPIGRMIGYADSPIGYPSNMQPGLAVAASFEIKNAVTAWNRFASRTVKPDMTGAPQWDILPRNIYSGLDLPNPPPVDSPIPVATPNPNELWHKIGVEGQKLNLPLGSRVRYGISGSYIEKDVGGEFTATNSFFGKDPAVGKVKDVELKQNLSTYSIKEKTVYILIGKNGVEMARFDDKDFAMHLLLKTQQ